MIGIRRPTDSTREQYAGLLGRVAAIEQVVAFILARDTARTGEDVLGILAALKAQGLNAAAQAGDAKSVSKKSFLLGVEQSFDGMRTTLTKGSDDGTAYGESRWA